MDIEADDPAGLELIQAIRTGDVATVGRLVDGAPGRAGARLLVAGGRTPLHIVSDWPGYFPAGPAVTRRLIAAGADPDARAGDRSGDRPDEPFGDHAAGETPLHWAASSDDVDVADALIDGGADVEAPGGSIGTPLDNAIGYGAWNVARRLVERGARVERLWQAAALGRLARVEDLLATGPDPAEVNDAFWHACRGGQLRVAVLLADHGAELSATVDHARGAAVDVVADPGPRRELLLAWLAGRGVRPSTVDE